MMKRFVILAAGLSVSLMCAGPVTAWGADAPSWDRYKVLMENNMFLRNRVRERPSERTVRTTVPVRVPERDFVLTGVVRRDSGCIAFVEDMRNGETLRMRSGDSIADGQIVEIGPDGLVYRKGDQSRDVKTGDALGRASSLPAPVATSDNTEGSAEVGASPASPSESAILERLRQRREKELKTQ